MSDNQGRRTALLVEDETLVAMVAEDSLQSLGFHTVWVETGTEALAVLARTPQLVLAVVDIGLPDMRGDDLALRMRQLAPRLPIIIASGYDGSDLKVKFAAAPALTLLAKPYSEHDLAQAISSLGIVSS